MGGGDRPNLMLAPGSRLKCPCPVYRGRHALGTFLCPGRSAPCTFLDQGQPALGTQGYQPWVQDGNSRLTALGTFLYWRQAAICTFLDQGRPAPGTLGYQPWVQDGNSGLPALSFFNWTTHYCKDSLNISLKMFSLNMWDSSLFSLLLSTCFFWAGRGGHTESLLLFGFHY